MKKVGIAGLVYALPVLAFAQTTAFGILDVISGIINTIIPILIALILVFFIYQAVMYVFAKDDGKRSEYQKGMIAGIVGLFVVLSVWGIIGIIQKTFGIGAGGTVDDSLIPGVEL